MTSQLADQAARAVPVPSSRVTVDLVVGDNLVPHRLGITPRRCDVTPTVADASFAWAMTARNERTATITVVGIDMPSAELEFIA